MTQVWTSWETLGKRFFETSSSRGWGSWFNMIRESRSGTPICGLLLWNASFEFESEDTIRYLVYPEKSYRDTLLSVSVSAVGAVCRPKSRDRNLSVDFITIPNDWRSSPNASSSSNHHQSPPPRLLTSHASSHAITGASDPEGFAQRWPTSRSLLMNTWSTVIEHLSVWMRFAELRHRRLVPRRRSYPTDTVSNECRMKSRWNQLIIRESSKENNSRNILQKGASNVIFRWMKLHFD